MIKKILIGADNLAFDMKSYLIEKLKSINIEVVDFGCTGEDDNRFYPEIGKTVCENLLKEDFTNTRAVLVCGTGLGMTIVANKFKDIYAAHCHDMYSCERSVLSNNSNVICFGAQIISKEFAWELLEKWLTLEFKDGRSTPKLKEIKDIEENNFIN